MSVLGGLRFAWPSGTRDPQVGIPHLRVSRLCVRIECYGCLSATQDHRSIDERCDAVGAERNLTPRELEVMKMLCKGRTKSYIAETLYLTETTVRSHTKYIYTKFDVRSKQELMDLVGA